MEFINIKRYSLLITIIVIFMALSLPMELSAQESSREKNQHPPHMQKKMEQLKKHLQNTQQETVDRQLQPVQSGIDLSSLNNLYTVFEHDQSWNRNPNPDPRKNFAFFDQGQPAGNINGDSSSTGNPIDDYIVTGIAKDEQTATLEDETWKTAVFLGDDTSEEADQIIRRKLVPVGDLNGDGYADAVAVEVNLQYPSSTSQQQAYIYKGTANGYVQTSTTLQNGFNASHKQIGFNDLNRDGYTDIFSYSNDNGDIIINWGAQNFNEVSSITYSEWLSFGSKRVVIKDVDQDTLKEFVELSGMYRDGQIQVTEIDTLAKVEPASAFRQEQRFGITIQGNADQNDLHLIDINGSGYDEIYVSYFSYSSFNLPDYQSRKVIVEYDSEYGQYNTNISEFFDGVLVPAGDLNNDGNHDFIQGDSTDNFTPHISYGPDDLSTQLSLDVKLNSSNSDDYWSWEMSYNPYSSFGDLDGNGINDALLSHSEFETQGRRILNGIADNSQSHNSTFIQYPDENFYSVTYETVDLGDINADGIDDFALTFYSQNKVEIYHGGTTISETPDITISLSYKPRNITSGDFDGDGISDLLLSGHNYRENIDTIELYKGGASMDAHADYSVNASDFQNVDEPEIFSAHNIGDVNDDGIDDFLTSSASAHNTVSGNTQYLNEAYIFFGGSISSSPDVTINMGMNDRYIWAGEMAASLGDINNDGVNDFAVSAAQKYDESNNSFGEVQIYYGGTNPSFTEPNMTLQTPQYTHGFGWGIAAGDFNDNGQNDIAVSSMQHYTETGTPSLVQIFNGGSEMDNNADRFLVLPDFELQNGISDNGPITFNYGRIETISDFTNDGKDELLATTGYNNSSHAALFTFNKNEPTPEIAIKAPNTDANLGSPYNSAVGDFNNNGQPDLVLTQSVDNNDAFRSSRIYRYGLPAPLTLTKVEDVPDDQGNRIRIHVGGFFMDAMSQDIYSFDNWSVWRMTEDNSWTNVKTVSPSSEGAQFVDVTVNKTQPTNVDSVDNSYVFRLEAFSSGGGVISRSDTLRGRAYDNLAPEPVQQLSISGEDDEKVLSWKSQGYQDVGEYIVYKTDVSGEESEQVMGTSTNTSFSELGNHEGVQVFGVKARDVNNNIGEASRPVPAIYNQTVGYGANEGWNLIGLPVDATAEELQAVTNNVESGSIYEFNGAYQQVDNIEPGKGYWIKFSDDNLYEVTGLPTTQLTLGLREGWNLVSGVGAELPVNTVTDSDGIIIPGTFYEFNQSYSQSDTVRPGNGYWVRASAAGTVTFNHPKLINNTGSMAKEKEKARFATTSEQVEKDFDRIIISDEEHEQTLYFGDELPKKASKLSYSIPPLPPGDVFDARFQEGTKLVEKEEVYIELNQLPGTVITLKTEVQSLAEHSQFTVKEFAKGQLLSEYTIEANKKVELAPDTDGISLVPMGTSSLTQSEKPDQFELKQNYPNPFNPTTQISYSVSEASTVTLEIFNVLGKRVATLVNEDKQPGVYDVTFDGSRVASGIYIYRLKAGNHISTRKLILAK